MVGQQTLDFAAPMSGGKLYQERARKALPLLVRQAEAGQKMFYSSLAEELGMSNPRNLNYVLGSIGQTLQNLSRSWNERIPPIQCLVVNKSTGLPGNGIGWFLDVDFDNLSPQEQIRLVDIQLLYVFNYERWSDVLAKLNLGRLMADYSKDNSAAANEKMGGGESEQHRKFKKFVAANPSVIDLPPGTPPGDLEVPLPSGDSLDVAFHASSEWVAAEVKSSISTEKDLIRGLYQCIKYQAVMQAVEATEARKRSARAILVIEGEFPKRLVPLRNILGVTVYDRVSISS